MSGEIQPPPGFFSWQEVCMEIAETQPKTSVGAGIILWDYFLRHNVHLQDRSVMEEPEVVEPKIIEVRNTSPVLPPSCMPRRW